MSGFAPLALTLLAAGLAFKSSPRVGLAVLFATVLLVPDTAFLRGSGFNNLPIYRIVLLAFVAGLVARVVRGEASADIFRPTRVHAAFGLWVAGAAVLGIGLSQPGLGTEPRVQAILLLADQAVLFVAVVACVRLLDDAWGVVQILVAVFAAAVAIAATEQVLGWSYGRWVLSRPGLRLDVLGAQELEERGGDTRVRAAAQFALGYAWVGAILLPLTLAYVSQVRSRILWILPTLGAATVLWTQSRSALPAMGLGVVLVAVLSGFRRHLVVFVVVAALGTTAIYLTESSVREPFESESTRDSDRGREDRQAVGFDRGAERPVVGHGLSSLTGRFRLHGLDLEYLKVYVELGVLGLVLFAWLLVIALLTCARGLRAPPGRQRSLAAAATTAVVLGAPPAPPTTSSASPAPRWPCGRSWPSAPPTRTWRRAPAGPPPARCGCQPGQAGWHSRSSGWGSGSCSPEPRNPRWSGTPSSRRCPCTRPSPEEATSTSSASSSRRMSARSPTPSGRPAAPSRVERWGTRGASAR